MSPSQIEHVAEILAAHAVLLLGVGLLAIGLSLAAVVLAVRTAVRFRHSPFVDHVGRGRRPCIVLVRHEAFSRLYLGVHFASDVIAGMAAGAAWVAVCVSALEVWASSRSRPPAGGTMAESPPSTDARGATP